MKIMGLDVDPQLVSFADWYHEDPGAKAFWSILDRRADFTAVVAANDLIAIGCYDVLNDTGRAIGGDVSVVGYNDMPLADKLSPPLTTVQIPHYAIGVRAADLILEILDDGVGSTSVSIKLTPTLMIRRSTGPAPS
jgi:LacI family transcriptional regulator